jgi:hypothetical protein
MSDKIEPANRLKKIVQTVYGIDVHPLAVLISKANYLMSLGNLLGKKDSSIVIPVYMADSIMYPLPTKSISNYGADGSEDVYLYEVEKNVHLTLPRSLVDAESADSIIDNIKDFAIKKTMNEEISSKGFHIF